MKRPFTTALVAAVVLAVVAAGAAVATTQTFMLGTSNRVDAATKVTNLRSNGVVNPIDAPLLTLENQSTTANATPLSLVAAANHPALKVNTGARIPNLNADRLDGLDSSGFLQGTGHYYRAADPTQGLISSPALLMQMPGVGSVSVECTDSNTNGSAVAVLRTSFSATFDGVYLATGDSLLHTGLAHTLTSSFATLEGTAQTVTLTGPSGGSFVSLHMVAAGRSDDTCFFAAEATVS